MPHEGGMKLWLRSYPAREDTHIHAFSQVVLPIDGRMTIRIGSETGSISGRKGVVIARGARHIFHVSGANRFIVLDLPPDLPAPTQSSSPFFGFDESLADLAYFAERELPSGSLGAEGEFHLAALIAEKIRRNLILPPPFSSPVEQALATMRERHAERLTMAELAYASGLKTNRFHELFRRETGQTPADTLANIRLDHAETLLKRTRTPIAEIALLAGFSEQSALTRSLKKRRGTTPAEVRRGLRRE